MKNKLYLIFTMLGVITFSFITTSCLKDDRYVDFSKVSTVIEFPDAIPGKSTALDLNPTSTADTIYLRVNATGAHAPTHDLVIGIGNGGAAGLTLYNQDASHVVGSLLPDTSYTLPSSTVTIVAGKDEYNVNNRTARFMVILHPNKIPTTLGVNYVLPIGITSVPNGTVASGNFGYILFNFYHNVYDGAYHSVGTRYNFGSPGAYAGWSPSGDPLGAPVGFSSSAVWDFPATKVNTVNANTCTVHAGNLDGGFGTFNITINPDNTVTITSTSDTGVNGLIAAGGGAPTSTYDPATKTLNLYYQYTNVDANNNPTTFRVLRDRLVHN